MLMIRVLGVTFLSGMREMLDCMEGNGQFLRVRRCAACSKCVRDCAEGSKRYHLIFVCSCAITANLTLQESKQVQVRDAIFNLQSKAVKR